MNPEVKTLWVAALRSGDFEQGARYLRRDNRLCCLGVLCEVALTEGVALAVKSDGSAVTYDGQSGRPPLAVRSWAMLDEAPIIWLIDMNDRDRSFDEIADWIEENL